MKDVRWQPLRAAVRPEQRRIYERFLDGRSYLAPSRLLAWTLRPGGRTPLYRVNERGRSR